MIAGMIERIVRNLSIMNGFPSKPMRSCLKRTGPGEVSFNQQRDNSCTGSVREKSDQRYRLNRCYA